LAAGEQGYDITLKSSKTGDGTTAWSALPWSSGLEAIYPVGAIYMSVVSTSPATLFGGTWAAWGAGRVPVGIDAADADFDTVEETGGAKTHTLAMTEIPSHYFALNDARASTLYGTTATMGSTTPQTYALGGGTGQNIATNTLGGGQAHNNLQPYIVCYMWKRTA
jgi:hypothetical protein